MTHHAIIANYNANLDAEAWAQMQDFVRGTIRFRYAPYHGESEVRHALSCLSGFADWALFYGVGPMNDTLLTAQAIDSYEAHRASEVLPSVAARERKILRTIAGIANVTEFDRTSTSTPVSQPYSPTEQGAIRRWAETQPSERRRSLCGAVVALTLGAGLTSHELMNVRQRDVVTLDDGMVGVRVGSRLVPVIEEWNDLIAHLADGRSEQYLIAPGRSQRDGQSIHQIIGRIPTHPTHPLPQRMRNTWLIRCLDAGVPLQNVVEAAGLESPEMLRRLIPFMAKLDGDVAVRAFRLAGKVAAR